MSEAKHDAMSEPVKPKRHRRKSIGRQLQQALTAAQALDNEPTNDMSIARMKFLQARLNVLAQMQARENNSKLKRALAEVARLTRENQELKTALTEASADGGSGNKHAAEIRDLLAKYGKETKEKNDVSHI